MHGIRAGFFWGGGGYYVVIQKWDTSWVVSHVCVTMNPGLFVCEYRSLLVRHFMSCVTRVREAVSPVWGIQWMRVSLCVNIGLFWRDTSWVVTQVWVRLTHTWDKSCGTRVSEAVSHIYMTMWYVYVTLCMYIVSARCLNDNVPWICHIVYVTYTMWHIQCDIYNVTCTCICVIVYVYVYMCTFICVRICAYNTLQHTATHCNTLQHTATHTYRVKVSLSVDIGLSCSYKGESEWQCDMYIVSRRRCGGRVSSPCDTTSEYSSLLISDVGLFVFEYRSFLVSWRRVSSPRNTTSENRSLLIPDIGLFVCESRSLLVLKRRVSSLCDTSTGCRSLLISDLGLFECEHRSLLD